MSTFNIQSYNCTLNHFTTLSSEVVQFEGVVSEGQDGFVPSVPSGAESVVHGVVAAVLPAPGRPPLQGRRQPRPGDQRAHHEVVVEDHGVLHQLGGHQVLATWGEVSDNQHTVYCRMLCKLLITF